MNDKLEKFIISPTNHVPEAFRKFIDKPNVKIGKSEKFGFFAVNESWTRVYAVEKGKDFVRGFKNFLNTEPVVWYKEGRVSRVMSKGRHYPRLSVDGKELAEMGWIYGEGIHYEFNKAQDVIIIRRIQSHDVTKIVG